jgi:hypothetical protein
MVPEQRFFSGDVPQDEGAFGGVLLVRVARACGDPGQQDVGGWLSRAMWSNRG